MSRLWKLANQRLLAKALGELDYEEVFCIRGDLSQGEQELRLKSGVVYRMQAWRTVWGHLRIQPESITRSEKGEAFQSAEDAAQLFLDAQSETRMDDIVLANFVEELFCTLNAEVELLSKNQGLTATDIAKMDDLKMQAHLYGHPKLIGNKGRLGWGADEVRRFAPESETPVRMHWLAIKKERSLFSAAAGLHSEDLINESMDAQERERFFQRCTSYLACLDDYHFVPAHPWQLDRHLRSHYAQLFANGELIDLGVFGDSYVPQISLRTFSNVSRPGRVDLKLCLNILNTSAFRGISPSTIEAAGTLSEELAKICEEDPFLRDLNVRCLRERAGASCLHPLYEKIKGAPYRYREMLGCIWRESSLAVLSKNERSLLTGALFHQDLEGRSVIGALIKASGLSVHEWVRLYSRHVILPLYHLQLRYGIGLVSHGQNIVLVLRENKPAGILVKDFQGDLRLAEEIASAKLKERFANLTRLPAAHLLHDLMTGHFITVLRFVSGALEEDLAYPESKFYGIVAEEIATYLVNHSSQVPESLSLLRPEIERVTLHPVRFEIGYADNARRPKPALGTNLKNPLAAALQRGADYV